ncbi:DENN domain-containing protein 1B-like isoform X1 [Pomacea canaliculata]|uniref:DENN domain-containing protein 1B-like isoform X1 n=1 Tax=Pomacea canaliculata TaxID=400727 RepID=UPI000D730D98|nr:DENN domain-containing protein 1B-like isoform X1 [Pomacea canaliculata]
MGSRLRSNPEKLFEVFAEVGRPQDEGQDAFILQKYPPDYNDQEVLSNIPKFAFPCSSNTAQVDQFTFVFTDMESLYRFGYCRHGTGAQTCLCIISCLPWFEVFYKMMNFLAELINRTENGNVIPFLKAVYEHDLPVADVPVTIVAGQEMFNFTAPDPAALPSIPASRNLTEYYNALDTNNMMIVFASMLHERRIIIISKKLSRVTACIHAAEALLYPMHWQHLFIPVLPETLLDYVSAPMPYLIGVHTSLYEIAKNKNMDIGDAVIVDADKNEVSTAYDDLDALPVDVLSYLKKNLKPEKVKNSMMESGDAISKAFLRALVKLIGGYRDALKMRPKEPITFDRDAFVLSRSSTSVQAFLENMLQLQIFQQFIKERLEILNSGEGFEDIFERECTLSADRNTQTLRYKDWLSKQGRKLKDGGKYIFSDMKHMAAPVVSTAVQSVKNQGKKAISKIREMNEGKTSSPKISGGVTYSREAGERSRPATITVPARRLKQPPRPPPPSLENRPRTTVGPAGLERRSSRTMSGIGDDNILRLSYYKVDVGLIDDPDIMKIMRSASAENLALPEEALPFNQSSSDEDVSSTPSSEAPSPSSEISSGIPYEDLQHSLAQDSMSLASSSTDKENMPEIRPRSGRRSAQVDHAISDRLISPVISAGHPVAPPRGLHKDRILVEPGSTSQPSKGAPVPLPRRTSLDRPPCPPSQLQKDKPLIHFDSSESEVDSVEQFDPLREPFSLEASVDGVSSSSSGLSRHTSSRNSLVMRTPAFRRPPPESPLRPGYRDESPEKEPSSDPLADLFDPLARGSGSSEELNPKRSPSMAANQSRMTDGSSAMSADSLMQDWTLEHLAGGLAFSSTVPAGSSLTCLHPPARTASPLPFVADTSPAFHKPPNVLHHSLPRPSSTSAFTPAPPATQPHTNSVLIPQRVSPVPVSVGLQSPDLRGLRTLNAGRCPGSELRKGTLPSVHQRKAMFENMSSTPPPARPQAGPYKKQWETFDN